MTMVKQADLVEQNQTQNRISIESSAKKVNTNLKKINVYKLSNYKLKQYIDTIFCESLKNKLSNSSKADTYKKLKNTPKFKKYLDDIKNIKYLKALTKLRLSDQS